jgi:hypothetical protein
MYDSFKYHIITPNKIQLIKNWFSTFILNVSALLVYTVILSL